MGRFSWWAISVMAGAADRYGTAGTVNFVYIPFNFRPNFDDLMSLKCTTLHRFAPF